MLHGYVCYTSKCKIFFKLKFSLPFFFLLKELIVKAVIYGCFTWSKRIWVHPEWWLLFTLAFIWPSFCNSNTSISVFTVSGLSFRLELVDIVNHCWIEKNLRLLLFFILYAEEFIVTEMMLWSQTKKKTVLFWLAEVNDGLTISLKDIFETEKESFFCWPYNLGNMLKYLVNKEACVAPISDYQISPLGSHFQ